MNEIVFSILVIFTFLTGAGSSWYFDYRQKTNPSKDLLRRYSELSRKLKATEAALEALNEENQNLKQEYQTMIEYRANIDLRLAKLNSDLNLLLENTNV